MLRVVKLAALNARMGWFLLAATAFAVVSGRYVLALAIAGGVYVVRILVEVIIWAVWLRSISPEDWGDYSLDAWLSES